MLRFLALGDSYIIGEGVPQEGRWPDQLVARLRSEDVEVAEPEIVAMTGWTAAELLDGIAVARPQAPFDLVSLCIGVNDQYRGADVDAFLPAFRAALGHALAFASGDALRVLVLSIPDWSVTPFAEGRNRERIASELQEYNVAMLLEVMRWGPHIVNVTGISRLAESQPDLLAEDGLHPSAKQYAMWVDVMMRPVRAALSRERHNARDL